MSIKDERRQRQQRFASLDAVERRAIVKAVNRGQPVDTRKHAPLAVHIAQRQMRFWKWSWLIGPAVGLLQLGQLGLVAALINALMASAFLGAMSAFFYLRAQRAEEANLAMTDRKRPAPRREETEEDGDGDGEGRSRWRGKGRRAARDRGEDSERTTRERTPRRWWGGRDHRPQKTPVSRGGHLPGEAPRRKPADDAASDEASGDGPGPSPGRDGVRRPYQPRGRKRRGR